MLCRVNGHITFVANLIVKSTKTIEYEKEQLILLGSCIVCGSDGILQRIKEDGKAHC
jgi:hypothetical protein